MKSAAASLLFLEHIAAGFTGFASGLASWTRLPGPWGGEPVSWGVSIWSFAAWGVFFVLSRLSLDEDGVVALNERVRKKEGLIFAACFLASSVAAAAGLRV